jgi:hypothetical protein
MRLAVFEESNKFEHVFHVKFGLQAAGVCRNLIRPQTLNVKPQ